MSPPAVAITRGLSSQRQLYVGGTPRLLLGLQWDCDSCFSREEMNPLFARARELGANMAALPLYWSEVEPTPGHYDFSMLDERLAQATAHDLWLVLLWFATWKNGATFYAPEYIRMDPDRYHPALDRNQLPTVSLCPMAEQTWDRDRLALRAVLEHLAAKDDDHRVVLFQIENEPGLVGTARCHCAACEESFVRGAWQNQYGADAEEAFTVVSIASYIERLAQEARSVLDLPYYVNVAIPPEVGGIPGEYFSGGAVPHMLALFRAHAGSLDLIAPDIYTPSYRDFNRLAGEYRLHSGPLYVAEHASTIDGRAEKNVFYAVGDHAAIGFDPWAIDACYPGVDLDEAYVDPGTGEIRPHARLLQESYLAIGRSAPLILKHQGAPSMRTVVQEESETSTGWRATGCNLLIRYHQRGGAGRGLLIQDGPETFYLIGVGFDVRFHTPTPDGAPVPIKRAEWGHFSGDRWQTLHPIRREHLGSHGRPVRLVDPGVARVILDIHGR